MCGAPDSARCLSSSIILRISGSSLSLDTFVVNVGGQVVL
jgi:hypothetical protein